MPKPQPATPDSTSVSSLYRQYGPIIYSRCRRLLGDESEAEQAAWPIFLDWPESLAGASVEESVRRLSRATASHCGALVAGSKAAGFPRSATSSLLPLNPQP